MGKVKYFDDRILDIVKNNAKNSCLWGKSFCKADQ